MIPVIVDVRRNIDGMEMVRCSYYSVQSDEPLDDWNLGLGGRSYPILLLHLEAIILGPPNGRRKFSDQSDFDAMYDSIEGEPGSPNDNGLFVDINDIWIPLGWFGSIELQQGLVFRIPSNLFSLCWKFRNERISTDEFLELRNELLLEDRQREKRMRLKFSRPESEVLGQWTQTQIDNSRERYHKSKLKLKKRRPGKPGKSKKGKK